MKEMKNCEFCGKRDFKFLFNGVDKNYDVRGKFKLVKCRNCGIIFINPQPQAKELTRYYPKNRYYAFGRIDKYGKKTKLKILLYDLYFNSKNRKYFLKAIFSPLRMFSRGTKIEKNAKLLDIGCGSGQFLYEMKQFGLKTWGVEPGDFDRETGKKENLNIFCGELKDVKYQNNYFDIITLNHVLEHVDNPDETIKEIHRILKKNGTFILGVPNYKSLAYWIFGRNWYQLDIPRHLFDYSDRILVEKLKKERFKIEKIRYNSRPSQFSVSMAYVFNPKFKRLFKVLDIFFLPLTYLVNFLRIGDQIEVYCKK